MTTTKTTYRATGTDLTETSGVSNYTHAVLRFDQRLDTAEVLVALSRSFEAAAKTKRGYETRSATQWQGMRVVPVEVI